MREADRTECAALGRSPKEGLRIGLRMSLNPITALVDDKPEAMFGAVPVSMVGGRAIVWMLGTDEVYRHGRALMALGPKIVDDMLSTFRSLENVVSVDNSRAIRFLARMGFHVGGPVRDYGGVGFVPFRLSRSIQGSRPSPYARQMRTLRQRIT